MLAEENQLGRFAGKLRLISLHLSSQLIRSESKADLCIEKSSFYKTFITLHFLHVQLPDNS